MICGSLAGAKNFGRVCTCCTLEGLVPKMFPAMKEDAARTEYALVRGLTRGLDVLRALNRTPGGRSSVAELARVTSIHRTTVRRLLETLASAGYVQSSASDGQFFVTLRVRDLSEGFTDREWISGVAAPVMGELLRKMRWPSDLTTLDGAAMFIRESTHRFSPLSFERAMVGIRMPLLLTASGRAYLAECDKEEQEQLIRLAAADPEQAAIATNRKLVSQMIAQVRKQGYASNEGDWHKGSRTSALAVAVHGHGRVLGCLNVIYAKRAASLKEACARFLPLLREASREIEARLERGAVD